MAIRPRQAEMDALGVDPEMLSPMEAEASAPLPPTDTSQMKEGFDGMMSEMAPMGDYSENAIQTLGSAVMIILELFGAEAMPVSMEVGPDGELPTDFVKAIMMLNQAQQDAGIMDYIIDVETLKDDRSLQAAAGKIMALSKNQTFRSFLAQLDEGFSAVEEVVETPSPAPMTSPSGEMDEEELFMRRIK